MDGQAPQQACFQPAALADALFQESGDALPLVDLLTERIIDVNPMTLRLSEFSREEILHGSIRSLVRHEQHWQDWFPPVQHTRGSLALVQQKDGFLLRTRQPDRWVPISLSISQVADTAQGGDLLILFTLRDRSEQVDAQRRLQRIEAELRRIVLGVSDCLWSCRIESDGRWRYRYLSPVVQRLTGRSAGLFLDDPPAWQQCVEPEDLSRWRAFRAQLTAGNPAELEYRIRRPDGSRLGVRENVVVTPCDEQGGLLLYGVVSRLGEPERTPQQSEGQQAQHQKLESLASLAGGVAHDINNLITGILGHVSLARLTDQVAPPTQVQLSQIEQIGLRAAELGRQLALVAGKGGVPRRLPRDLNSLVRDVAEQLQRKSNLRVRLHLGSLPAILGDEEQLRQVIGNLLANALDVLVHTQGEVEVRTWSRSAGGEIGHRAEPVCFEYLPKQLASGSAVCLEVSDNGPGLSPEARARLFDPFFSTKPGGRGLGLSTVLGIVRGHQGGIGCRTLRGAAPPVRVFLCPAPEQPGSPSAELAAAQAGAAPAWRGQGTILLADDEETVLDVAARLLSSVGYRVLRARDGESALRQFEEHASEVRLALVDLTMPRLSGEATLRELRRRCQDLPLVLMSGYPSTDILPRCADLELAGYLQKPFRLPVLLELLQRVLPG